MKIITTLLLLLCAPLAAHDNRCILDVDRSDRVRPFVDGIILMRWFNGFRGSDLVVGVQDPDATRTSPAILSKNIKACRDTGVWDVNGDAIVDFDDANLMFVYMVGIRETGLEMTASAGGCVRCDAPSLVGYLEALRAGTPMGSICTPQPGGGTICQ